MPCDSSYLNPTAREKELQRAARLLKYVYEQNGVTPSRELIAAAEDQYCDRDFVAALCNTLKKMSNIGRDRLVYNARNKTARDLADWWEEHQEADKRREDKEREELRQRQLFQSAMNKLTPEEREAVRQEAWRIDNA